MNTYRNTVITSTLIGVALLAAIIAVKIRANYIWEKDYGNLWTLADRASTISAKQQYMRKFVQALELGKFAEHNAVLLKTPQNNFGVNLSVLKTLSTRLDQIQDMNPSSFEYNTAIQQITAQEQGDARAMMDIFNGCFELEKYPLIWGWIGVGMLLLSVCLIGWGPCVWIACDI